MSENGQIKITVDGREIRCEQGELLIEVAKRAGIYIPYFCYHPRMDPVGACRMCLVHVEGGPPKPFTACTTRVNDGMVIETQFANPEIRKAQEGVLEFLLLNHPLDCPICDRGGECPLQDQTQDYGPTESRFLEPKRRFPKPVSISSLVKLDRERCILCYRCTRFCEELSGDTLIGVMERGPDSYIYPYEGEAFDSYFSGNTVQICPVGALTASEYRFQARPWDLQHTPSTCNMCAAGCSLDVSVRVQDGKIVRMTARTNDDTNEDWLCDKGRWGHRYVSASKRLLQPLVRGPEGLAPVSWDEAFRALTQNVEPLLESGVEGRAALLVGESLCDEDTYAAQKFARVVLATNGVDHRLEGGMQAEALVPPALTYADVCDADHVVLVSLDAREELPLVFLRLRIAATKKGLGITVVHPRRVALADQARDHLAPFPGAEALVGASLAAVLGQPVAAGADALASGAGLPTSQISTLAEHLRAASRACIVLGPRVAADPDAVRAWKAAAKIAGARLGWAPRRAGAYGALAVGAHPELLPGWRRVANDAERSVVADAWGVELPDTPGLDCASALRRAASGEMDLLWLVGADIRRDVPDAELGQKALEGARYVVVQDVQDSALFDKADLVFPAAAFGEREGTLTDWEGRRQPVHQAVDPPGAARADYAILAEAARRLGRPIGCRRIDDVRAELDGLLRSDVPAADAAVETVRLHPPAAEGEFPLRLLTYRLLYDDGSRVRHTDGITEQTPDAFCEINSTDADHLGITDGRSVRVSSAHGSIVLPVRVTDTIRAGVVFVPYLQPESSAQALLEFGDPAPAVKVEAE